MTTDTPVYARATCAPWREILRQRLSGRLDRALVLRDLSGVHYLAGRRSRRATPLGVAALDAVEEEAAKPVAVGLRLRGYDSAFLVQLDEYTATRSVALPTHFGTESLDVHVLWWVNDPVQVVRSHTTHGWLAVRRALDRRLHDLKKEHAAGGPSLGVPEVMQSLAVPDALPECGLTYRVTDISAREEDGQLRLGEPDGGGLPYSWTDRSREEYDFCKRAVQDGPVSLAALWLVRHPEQVSQVLDWTVNHRELVRGDTDWQDEVAGLLGKLTAQEQQELSELLRDRLAALGRRVPGQQGSRKDRTKARPRVNGWTGGTSEGQWV